MGLSLSSWQNVRKAASSIVRGKPGGVTLAVFVGIVLGIISEPAKEYL